jgi:hypothetical protein
MSEKELEKIIEKWTNFRIEVEQVDFDMNKALTKGNAAAGRRVRTKFRTLKKLAAEIIKDMISYESNQTK